MNEFKKNSTDNSLNNIKEPFTTKKSFFTRAKLAALLSFFFMGLGQMYNKQYLKGVSFLALELYLLLFLDNSFSMGDVGADNAW